MSEKLRNSETEKVRLQYVESHSGLKRDNVLTRITKSKGKVTVMESDHQTIISKLNIKHNKQISSSRLEMFNLKNKECQIKFKVITNKITILSSAFRENENLNKSAYRFIKRLNGIIHSCFKKVRIGGIKENPKKENP